MNRLDVLKNFRNRNKEGKAINAFDYLDAVVDYLVEEKEDEYKRMIKRIRYNPGFMVPGYGTCTEVDPFEGFKVESPVELKEFTIKGDFDEVLENVKEGLGLKPKESKVDVVEVGQIWRAKGTGTNCKVESLGENGPYVSFKDHATGSGSVLNFFERYELVTMENLKPYEWVECIEGIEDLFRLYKVGQKYRVKSWLNGSLELDANVPRISKKHLKHFKPCLLTVEKTEFARVPLEEAVENCSKCFKMLMKNKRTIEQTESLGKENVERALVGINSTYIEGRKPKQVILSEDVYRFLKDNHIKVLGTGHITDLTLCGLKILIAYDPDGELVDYLEVV